MTIIESAILGLVQGLAEFLPISSSGHLNLIQSLFSIDATHQLLFNLLLHMGTLIAVMVVFWRDWLNMLRHPIKDRTLLLLFIASLPALAGKLLFDEQLDYYETHNVILGVCFLITGLLLMLTQLISSHGSEEKRANNNVNVKSALTMGVMQAVGMLPGISRSGSTIFGGVASRLSREKAAKFSFMMSAPAIVAGMVSEGYSVVKGEGLGDMSIAAVAVGMAVAGISGYLAIRFMLRLISKVSLNWFALYVILLGIAVIVMQAMGVMTDGGTIAAAVPLVNAV